MKLFFGFAIADSMFADGAIISKKTLSADTARMLINDTRAAGIDVVPCLNPSHAPTIKAMTEVYGIEMPIPEKAPQVSVGAGDAVMVMGVRGLPRLDATRHEYTQSEIDGASFVFSLYEVKQVQDYDQWATTSGMAFSV